MGLLRTEKGSPGKLNRTSRLYQYFSRTLHNHIPHLPSRHTYNITTCDEKKFLWYRVAKVGSRSIIGMMRRNNLYLDAAHPMFCHYSPQAYDNYFKFAFVRNPWDRLVSCWKNKVVDRNYFRLNDDQLRQMQSFENFVEFVKDKDLQRCDQHLRLQSELIDLNEVSYIGRFENFDNDLLYISRTIGIEYEQVHKNQSEDKSDYRKYYDDNLMNTVAGLYHRDINLFHYKFSE